MNHPEAMIFNVDFNWHADVVRVGTIELDPCEVVERSIMPEVSVIRCTYSFLSFLSSCDVFKWVNDISPTAYDTNNSNW